MIQKLDFLVRFWELKGRHAELGEPLDQREQTELLSLLQLVTSDLRVPEIGAAARSASSLPAQIIAERASVGAELRAITASALVVVASQALAVGAHAIVRVTDAVDGVEYVLPCKVAWVHVSSGPMPYTVALVVDGVPTRAEFDAVPSRPRSAPLLQHAGRLMPWSSPRPQVAARRQ